MSIEFSPNIRYTGGYYVVGREFMFRSVEGTEIFVYHWMPEDKVDIKGIVQIARKHKAVSKLSSDTVHLVNPTMRWSSLHCNPW